jgi:regulator of protease activity HflC (stomatin/prohibitin superfamily)
MILILLGVIVLIAAFTVQRTPNLYSAARSGKLIGIILIAIGILTSCFVQIDAGQVGVQKLFGKVQSNVLNSGLNFVNPVVNVERLDVRTKNYTMSGITDEGRKSGDDAIRVLTADGLEVTIDLTVLYRVIPGESPRLIRETGADYEDKIVRPIARTRIRDNAVYYEAISLYSTKRDEFQNRIFKGIEADFRSRGLLLENLLVRNITLPTNVKATIEQKIQAEQESQKMQFILAKERQDEQIKATMELAKSQNAKIIMMGGKGTPVILDAKQ